MTVFTTRPDTTWGVTFMVLAPEHSLAQKVAKTKPEVAAYIKKAQKKKEWERTAEGEKDGVDTGLTVTNPLNGEKVQLWVADYVIATYGTGVVMGVPAHDTRDFAFAKKYGIPIRVVIQPEGKKLDYLIHKTFMSESGQELLAKWTKILIMTPTAESGMDSIAIGLNEGTKQFIRNIILTINKVDSGES